MVDDCETLPLRDWCVNLLASITATTTCAEDDAIVLVLENYLSKMWDEPQAKALCFC